MSSTRRSARPRRQPHTIYDEARTRGSLESLLSSGEKNKKDKQEQVKEDDDNLSSSEQDSTSDEEEEEEEEEFTPSKRQERKRKSPSPKEKTPQSVLKAHKIQVRQPNAKKKSRKSRDTSDSSAAAPARKTVHGALTVLSKKVLEEGETPENSLLAALLQAYQVDAGDDDHEQHEHPAGTTSRHRRSPNDTLYSVQLKNIAKLVVESHKENRNQTEADLVNLIFRSIGGSVESMVDPEQVDMENMSNDDLNDIVTELLNDMEYTATDCVLMCAHPQGTVYEASDGGKASVGALEYRKIYKEFWYQLTVVILSDTSVSTAQMASASDGDSDSEDEPEALSSLKFQVEMAKEILQRLLSFVLAPIHDLRAVITIAMFEMGAALLDQTVELKAKIQVANRQLNAAKRSKQHRKMEALEAQIGSWNRAVTDLEALTEKYAIGIFLQRYRDTNQYIRSESIQALSRFTRIRPDIFLCNKFLKYFGWVLSDKSAHVRQSALKALLAPFRANKKKQTSDPTAIDTSCMRNVIEKFMDRLCECVIDVDTNVQEVATELLVVLVRKGFLDSLDDDDKWTQINMRAIAPDTTPSVRYNAFLLVIHQLEPFDTDSSTLETGAAARISALVNWIAHNLIDGDIPVERVRYELTDFVVTSLRNSPEHRSLACNWTAMLRALETDGDDASSTQADRQLEAVKQRILLRFFVCAAEMEVSGDDSGISQNLDPDVLEARKSEQQNVTGTRKKQKGNSSHEELTFALMGALPSLLTTYKTETAVLQSLTGLPQYFLPSVFALSSRKKDLQSLIKKLSEVFLESTDKVVLQNCALALVSLAKGEHARTADVQVCLKKTVRSLQDRLLELLEVKVGLASDGDKEDDDVSPVDTEHSISLCLRRLSILSKRVYIGEFLVDSTDMKAQDKAVENLFNTVAEHVAKELNCRKVAYKEEDDGPNAEIPSIWTNGHEGIHKMVAEAVTESFWFLLCTAAWRVNLVVENLATEEKSATEGHIVVRMRDHLVKLVSMCFEQFLERRDGDSFTKEHIAFSELVQKQAGRAAGDIRVLFPKLWSTASSRLLSSFALVDDGPFIGGFVRFLRSQEGELRKCEISDNQLASEELLLPLARGLTANWKTGNRREAGAALGHIVGSGAEASRLVASMSRVFKKIEPVRLLEAHMACLRQAFDDWLDSEPDDPPESNHQTEEEVGALLEAEKAHKAKFEAMEHQALRLSQSLGVGKLNDKVGARALYGFVQEGVRFAFSSDEPGFDEELPVGSRLAFLRVLSKYLGWIRREEESRLAILEYFNQKEADLRNDPGFVHVLDEDKEALKVFRKAGDLGAFFVEDFQSAGSYDEHTDHGLAEKRPSSQPPRFSMGSSISSIRSKVSAQASLSPVIEDDTEEGEGDSPAPMKRRRLSSISANASVSTAGHTQNTMEEEESGDGSESE